MGFCHNPSDPLYELTGRDAQLTDETGATMTGLLPGVPRLHITYVHLAVAFFLYAALPSSPMIEKTDSKLRAGVEPSRRGQSVVWL